VLFRSFVIRLGGSDLKATKDYLATIKSGSDAPIVVEDLDEAVAEAIRLAKSHRKF